ncbi:RNA polymerase sigma-70 factor (ECF subfamily) [Chitinophaga skermanii]|uniref:RNA polymerase sigma-70 factor (ECF subfamily) n=1 Tax=Chitinophaga skermanii TaxID=331697 RepID=A0A327R1N9_9BACT|nr:RNA polymerase sigma-70 factor [Chitinophaga skermanii]RAJ10786.1 RNA polymerase sigma-70 factor (ECF subfamily) [Chitinophaga skermanii]
MLTIQEFEHIFKTQHHGCIAFATQYTGDPHVAEEVVQLVFTQLWEKRSTIDIQGTPKSYLLGAIRNTAISHWRKQQVRNQKETDFGQSQSQAADMPAFARDLENMLQLALQKLPERCREVFVLSRQQHLKYAEIADTMGISIKTVENQMGKALKILHEELKEFLPLILLLLSAGKGHHQFF